MPRTTVLPLVLLILGLASFLRFLPNVRSVDAIGLFAGGALVGVSAMRLLAARKR